MLTNPVLRKRTRDHERGSVVIAISALMLLLLIGTSLILRSQVELRAVVADADADAAQAGAEQGVAEVLARLEAGDRGDFSGDGEAGGGKYSYTAEQLSDTEYFVRAEGYVGERVRAVEVTIGGELSAQYSLFINYRATFSDNSGSVSGHVATNGPLSVKGSGPGDVVDLYGGDAQCERCRVTVRHPDRLEVPDPRMPTGTIRGCPSDGVFTGQIDGKGGVPFLCTSDTVTSNRIAFNRTVTVINPPLIIYVRSGLDVLIKDASVNTDGKPEDFQVYAQGDRSVYWRFDVWNSKVQGILFAPNRSWVAGSANIVGSMATGVLEMATPNHLWIRPSETATDTAARGWTVTSWQVVPAS